MNHILDARDEIEAARDLVELIAMTTRNNPDEDQRAISAGCQAILTRISTAAELLKSATLEAAA